MRTLFLLWLALNCAVGFACVPEAHSALASLAPAQLQRTRFGWDAKHRKSWDWTPGEREGIAFKDLNESQRRLFVDLFRCTLSTGGVALQGKVLERETLLGKIEENPAYRNAGLYYFALYGEPSAKARWGYRFEGHHYSLNAAFDGAKLVATTPLMVGANPVKADGHETLLEKNTALAVKLLASLTPAQMEKARQSSGPMSQFFSGATSGNFSSGADSVPKVRQEGVSSDALSQDSKVILEALLESYLEWIQPELRAAWVKERSAVAQPFHFVWWGNPQAQGSHHFRISHPRLLIEHNAIQGAGNHVHAVLRDPQKDFAQH